MKSFTQSFRESWKKMDKKGRILLVCLVIIILVPFCPFFQIYHSDVQERMSPGYYVRSGSYYTYVLYYDGDAAHIMKNYPDGTHAFGSSYALRGNVLYDYYGKVAATIRISRRSKKVIVSFKFSHHDYAYTLSGKYYYNHE